MRTDTNNASRALAALVTKGDVTVTLRLGDGSRVTGVLMATRANPNGRNEICLDTVMRPGIFLDTVETIEIVGGLREAHAAAEVDRLANKYEVPPALAHEIADNLLGNPGGIAGAVLDGSYDGPNG